MVTAGINGFGRIGRLVFRIGLLKHAGNVKFGAINTSGSMPTSDWAHLANYDTMYRKFELKVESEELKDAKDITEEDPLIGYLLIREKN
ncbi:type I glyceraldehyde-3-phosphate dehydrogenase, partial [Patescibacteria group bacterium]|nr:type I glyceraldehyde-3-phosphate dehydrogenase [Patescibacteria group bacterium]